MKLITLLEGMRNQYDEMSINQKVELLLRIADDYDLYDITQQIVTDEQINDIIQEHIDNGANWTSIYFMLQGIRMANQRYYYFNGYANIENLTPRLFYILLDDFIDEVKYNQLENEEI